MDGVSSLNIAVSKRLQESIELRQSNVDIWWKIRESCTVLVGWSSDIINQYQQAFDSTEFIKSVLVEDIFKPRRTLKHRPSYFSRSPSFDLTISHVYRHSSHSSPHQFRERCHSL
jgi:hypothetical protein